LLLLVFRWPWPGGDAPAASLADQTDAAKAAAADVLGALMAQPSHGPRVSLLMGKLLPPGLVASIAEGPPAAVLRALGQVGACWADLSVTYMLFVSGLKQWCIQVPSSTIRPRFEGPGNALH
jgi:hypothetical protein